MEKVAGEQLTGFLVINKIIELEAGKAAMDFVGMLPVHFLVSIAAIGGTEIFERVQSGDVEQLSEMYLESIRARVHGSRQSMHTRRLMRMDARAKLNWSH